MNKQKSIKINVNLVLDRNSISSSTYDYHSFLGDVITDLFNNVEIVYINIIFAKWKAYYGYNPKYECVKLILLDDFKWCIDSHNRKGMFGVTEKDCFEHNFEMGSRRLSSFKYTIVEGIRTLSINLRLYPSAQIRKPTLKTSYRVNISIDNISRLNPVDTNLIKLLAWNQQCSINKYTFLREICYNYLCNNVYDNEVRFVLLFMWYYWGRTYKLLENYKETLLPYDIICHIAFIMKSLCYVGPFAVCPEERSIDRFYIL